MLNKYINKEVDVLFEHEQNGYVIGHTSNYIVVKSKGKNIENKILKVKILNQDKLELIGKLWNKNVTNLKQKRNTISI